MADPGPAEGDVVGMDTGAPPPAGGNAAAEEGVGDYLERVNMRGIVDTIVNASVTSRAADPQAFMRSLLSVTWGSPVVDRLEARVALDASGRAALETSLFVRYTDAEGAATATAAHTEARAKKINATSEEKGEQPTFSFSFAKSKKKKEAQRTLEQVTALAIAKMRPMRVSRVVLPAGMYGAETNSQLYDGDEAEWSGMGVSRAVDYVNNVISARVAGKPLSALHSLSIVELHLRSADDGLKETQNIEDYDAPPNALAGAFWAIYVGAANATDTPLFVLLSEHSKLYESMGQQIPVPRIPCMLEPASADAGAGDDGDPPAANADAAPDANDGSRWKRSKRSYFNLQGGEEVWAEEVHVGLHARPRAVVPMLHGGRYTGSTKCRFATFGVFTRVGLTTAESVCLLSGIYHALGGLIGAKYGAAAAQGTSPLGGYTVAIDSTDTILTLLEDAMAAAGAGEGDAFVWVDVGAGAFYNPDTRKYDIGSHHSRTGSDMGDYYNKLANSHPCIGAFEDPFDARDHESWMLFAGHTPGTDWTAPATPFLVVANELVDSPAVFNTLGSEEWASAATVSLEDYPSFSLICNLTVNLRKSGVLSVLDYPSDGASNAAFEAHAAVAGMMSFVKSGLVGGHCAARINALLEIDDEMIAQAALLNPAADGDDDGGKVGTTSARA